MYQALYRKWRPQTFDEVTGQSHITETLKTQVASGRLSHAYLFTGTRGTGKTTCAKILARAVNCEHPVNGNPCNCCPSCRGILDESILDVVEMDAASNNGVDSVRALRDEAIYSPTAVRKRVYIIDEVHMLSGSAFNALLKILEEPPEHLMFILATTELHKVLPTILSRCQRFSFRRIPAEDISRRLDYVAGQEGIELTQDGSTLLARLADGGMRDALSLLDQCAAAGGTVDRQHVLDTLGLAGNLKTAHIFNAIRKCDAGSAVAQFGELYAAGKDVSSVLSELISLSRDLLIRQTAPGVGAGLLVGGYDEATLKTLSKNMPAERLISMLNLLEAATEDCKRSGSSRTVAELCLIRLCDPSMDETNAGLAARIAILEEKVAKGVTVVQAPAATQLQNDTPDVWEDERPPFDDADVPPVAGEPEPPMAAPAEKIPAKASAEPQTRESPAGAVKWPELVKAMRGRVPVTVLPFLSQEGVTGVVKGDVLTVWIQDDFGYELANKPDIVRTMEDVASGCMGHAVRVELRKGAPEKQQTKQQGSMNDLLDFMKKNH